MVMMSISEFKMSDEASSSTEVMNSVHPRNSYIAIHINALSSKVQVWKKQLGEYFDEEGTRKIECHELQQLIPISARF